MNAKGGSGKTTVATNLAGYFARKGASVALADFDPQGSSIDWLRQRRGNLPKIIGLEASEKFPKLSSLIWSPSKTPAGMVTFTSFSSGLTPWPLQRLHGFVITFP